jgi:hypothetical protein
MSQKTKRMEKIAWEGPYADEKYTWQCLTCHKKYISRNQATECYDRHETQKQTNTVIKELLSQNSSLILIQNIPKGQFPCHPCNQCSFFDMGICECTKDHIKIPFAISKLIRCKIEQKVK